MSTQRTNLTEREERFCREFVKVWNAPEAAGRAGFKSKRSDLYGVKLLADDRIRARICELLADRAERIQVTSDRIVTEIARIALANPKAYARAMEASSAAEALAMLSEPEAAAISQIKVERTKQGPRLSIIFHDKLRALELLTKILGLTSETYKVVHSGEGGVPVNMLKLTKETKRTLLKAIRAVRTNGDGHHKSDGNGAS